MSLVSVDTLLASCLSSFDFGRVVVGNDYDDVLNSLSELLYVPCTDDDLDAIFIPNILEFVFEYSSFDP